jgi:thiol-disulfide isomerase/thioredoxin
LGKQEKKTRKLIVGLAAVVIVVVAVIAGVVWLRTEGSSTQTIASLTQTQATCKSVKQVGRGEFYLPIVDRNGLTGKYLDLSKYRCKVVVLEFMGPWCPPCQQMVPAMETLYRQYADKGVVFIAVVIPWSPSHSNYTNVDITEFLSKYNSSLTYVLDSKGAAASMYNPAGLPALFVISKSGAIYGSYVASGSTGTEVGSPNVAKDIDKALSEPEPA